MNSVEDIYEYLNNTDQILYCFYLFQFNFLLVEFPTNHLFNFWKNLFNHLPWFSSILHYLQNCSKTDSRCRTFPAIDRAPCWEAGWIWAVESGARTSCWPWEVVQGERTSGWGGEGGTACSCRGCSPCPTCTSLQASSTPSSNATYCSTIAKFLWQTSVSIRSQVEVANNSWMQH